MDDNTLWFTKSENPTDYIKQKSKFWTYLDYAINWLLLIMTIIGVVASLLKRDYYYLFLCLVLGSIAARHVYKSLVITKPQSIELESIEQVKFVESKFLFTQYFIKVYFRENQQSLQCEITLVKDSDKQPPPIEQIKSFFLSREITVK